MELGRRRVDRRLSLRERVPRLLPELLQLPARHPRRGTNGGGFCRSDFDALVAQARALQATNPAKAEELWAKADRLAVDQAAWVPTVSTAAIELLSRRTGHFTLDPNSQPQIDQLWVR
jgi:ABC-type oligopeptide transport system substrate-binding subunit